MKNRFSGLCFTGAGLRRNQFDSRLDVSHKTKNTKRNTCRGKLTSVVDELWVSRKQMRVVPSTFSATRVSRTRTKQRKFLRRIAFSIEIILRFEC
jgi:hypothetical protein